jgi:Fic family protein
VKLFSEKELLLLRQLHKIHSAKLDKIPPSLYKKEMERLSIDLSWKSSQIEGNTYSLLETERLLKENQTAEGKSKEEAVMLLNHKKAIDQIIENPSELFPVTRHSIEKIHAALVTGLGVEFGTRTTGVGITGTNYKPLEYEQQITRAMNDMCHLIGQQSSVFNKALLLLVLISYIQPYTDGNKRTARIVSNAVLLHEKTCPISFRTTDSMDFKKALLLFYEQNNITRIKDIFIEQYDFAINTYF